MNDEAAEYEEQRHAEVRRILQPIYECVTIEKNIHGMGEQDAERGDKSQPGKRRKIFADRQSLPPVGVG
jgi:hypothetical protein